MRDDGFRQARRARALSDEFLCLALVFAGILLGLGTGIRLEAHIQEREIKRLEAELEHMRRLLFHK